MKGRKNSTPKVMSTITFSPDGAITSFDKSNLGSLSNKNLLIYFVDYTSCYIHQFEDQ